MRTELSTQPVPQVLPIAYPLDEFYALSGLRLPHIEAVSPELMPEPQRSLLVHENDMTPTLEAFHRQTLHLTVLRRQQRDDFYFREVLLITDRAETPVEFGAIKINLSLFPQAARRLILEETHPLGHILRDCAVAHTSRPKAFLKLEADDFISRSLGLSGKQILYGRRNTLADLQHRSLAEIVEILPPAQGGAPSVI